MERKLNHPQNSAVALVLVLGMLALLSVIVIAFLSNVKTDLTASRSYEDHASTRALADSAINLVIAQIREASTDASHAWISQPGLIRTFAGSAPDKAYKLYSDALMQETGAFDPAAAVNQPPLDWHEQPNLYTDLNAPVFKGGTAVFPILDGNAIRSGTVAGTKALIYDANGDGLPDVEGFSIDPSRVKYDAGEALSTGNNPVAMPVKWLYMLKDGTLLPAKSRAAGYDVEVGDATTKPTLANPIIARVAFWTDDDTSKVNLNTASEGTFWDTPVGVGYKTGGQAAAMGTDFDPASMSEADLAYKQGAQREFQRYPGHPATTSLSPVLGPTLRTALGLPPNPRGLERYKLVKAITDLVPRVTDDSVSSQGGTKRAGGGTATNAKVAYDSDRLFATPDEMFFSTAFTNSTRQTPSGGTAGALMKDEDLRKLVERTRFFLTTTSKAPEQNLFNKPRVAIWPLDVSPNKRTTFDKLIAFCGTVNNGIGTANQRPFYFTRSDPMSATADYANSARNKQVYQYLQMLTGQSIPGFGMDFASKYGADRDQILTEIFDYIRCTNLVDTSEGASKTYTSGTDAADPYATKRGQVVPITIGTTRGFGRIATISELALVVTKLKDPAGGKIVPWDPSKQSKLEFTLLPELFSPMAGFSAMADDLRLKFEASDFKVTDKTGVVYYPFKTAASAAQPDLYVGGRVSNPQDHASKVGGNIGVGTLFEEGNAGGSAQATTSTPGDSVPPNGKIIIMGISPSDTKPTLKAETMTIEGTVTVSIRAPAASGPEIQNFTFRFPKQQVPVPSYYGFGSGEAELASSTGGSVGSKVKGYRISGGQGYKLETFIQGDGNEPGKNPGDTIRSLTATGRATAAGAPLMGDMRLVAAARTIDASWFKPLRTYNNPGLNQSHALRNGFRYVFSNASFGKLAATAAGVDYVTNSKPDLPDGWLEDTGSSFTIDGVKNAYQQAGDWDNGPGLTLDGPYVNKADEGTDGGGGIPYIGEYWFAEGIAQQLATFFSPNRQMPSAGMFGSLSTGVKRGLPWQTLLFRPAKPYLPGGRNHPGGDAPPNTAGTITKAVPDHLLLDLFWMPIVEPYAISEPFATSGTINLNYQIAPFTYIKRDTGLRAVLASTMITAINPTQKTSDGKRVIENFKNGASRSEGALTRRQIDADHTLRQFDELRFKAGVNKPFISASEICDIPLIPKDVSGAVNIGITNSTPAPTFDSALGTFWESHRLTGDNSLERPYTLIYPRVTTRSNSYTVHVRVQTLKKAPADLQQASFRDGRDQVLGEFRGSFVIERYLDANTAGFYVNGDLAKPSDETNPAAVLGPYRFRVVSSKQFGL
jgi:uncharacterized protein (TIGR02600 family)